MHQHNLEIYIFYKSRNLNIEKMEFYVKFNKISIKLSSTDQTELTYETLNNRIQSEFNLKSQDYNLFSSNGILIRPNFRFQNGQTFQIDPKVLGGKVSYNDH